MHVVCVVVIVSVCVCVLVCVCALVFATDVAHSVPRCDRQYSGTTATFAVAVGSRCVDTYARIGEGTRTSRLYVANIGDSRAILVRTHHVPVDAVATG